MVKTQNYLVILEVIWATAPIFRLFTNMSQNIYSLANFKYKLKAIITLRLIEWLKLQKR